MQHSSTLEKMMGEALTQIKLPTDRVNQLRLFAAGMGAATLSGALGAMFKAMREQGLIAHGIPSIQIHSLSEGMASQFDQGEIVEFNFDEAQSFAIAIKDCLSGKNEGRKIVVNDLKIGGSYSVHGHGNALAVSVPENFEPKMFTRDLALEFAELLEHEAPKTKA